MTRTPSRDAKSSPASYKEGSISALLLFAASDRTVDFNQELRTVFFTHVYNQDVPVKVCSCVYGII